MHRHVDVSPAERDAWLLCMQRAVDSMAFERDVSERLMKHFRVVANVLEIENRKNEKTRAAAR
jgi:hemoglobin